MRLKSKAYLVLSYHTLTIILSTVYYYIVAIQLISNALFVCVSSCQWAVLITDFLYHFPHFPLGKNMQNTQNQNIKMAGL